MAAARPAGKVAELGPDCFSPRLVYNKQLVPLGEHDTRAAAEAAYDLGKMLLALKLGGQLASLKLHQPAAAYTANPLWQELAGPHRTFEKACSLLAAGAAAGFLPGGGAHQPGVSAGTGAAATEGHPPSAAATAAEEGSAAGAEEPPAEGGGVASRWLEFPEGSKQYCIRMSKTAARKGSLNLPAWVRAAAFRLAGSEGRISMQELAAHQSSGGSIEQGWSVTSYIDKRYHTQCVLLRIPTALLKDKQASKRRSVKPGDVLVVQNRGLEQAAAQFWPAGSQQAQAYNAFDAVLPAFKGRQPGVPSSVAAAGAGSAPKAAASRRDKRKRRDGEDGGISAAASAGAASNAAEANTSVPAAGAASGPGGMRRCSWEVQTAADGTACISLVLSEAVVMRQASQTIPSCHAECLFGCLPSKTCPSDQPSMPLTLTSTADGRHHNVSVKQVAKGQWYLRGIHPVLRWLAAAPGDRLSFQSTGPGAARVTLVKAAAVQGGASEDEDDGESGEGEEEGEAEGPASTFSSLPSTEVAASDAATAATGTAAAAGAGGLLDVDRLREDDGRLWMAVADVLALMETQGGVAAAAASAYQRAFVGLSTHNWRLAHYVVLKGFAERQEWRQAADWMHRAGQAQAAGGVQPAG